MEPNDLVKILVNDEMTHLEARALRDLLDRYEALYNSNCRKIARWIEKRYSRSPNMASAFRRFAQEIYRNATELVNEGLELSWHRFAVSSVYRFRDEDATVLGSDFDGSRSSVEDSGSQAGTIDGSGQTGRKQ